MAAHLLIIGGDPVQNEAVAQTLESSADYDLASVTGAQEALAHLELPHQRCEAIIINAPLLDTGVPRLCRLLDERGVRIPIIVLNEAVDEIEIVQALDAGAIDYIIKPLRPKELQARLSAHIRQHETSDRAILEIEHYHFRPAERSLYEPVTHRLIRLTSKETGLLRYLYRAAGEVVSRRTLLQDVWGYGVGVQSHTLEAHIYRLRRKIERDPTRPLIILSDNGGYYLGDFRTGALEGA